VRAGGAAAADVAELVEAAFFGRVGEAAADAFAAAAFGA
jgi:hypothetical protein